MAEVYLIYFIAFTESAANHNQVRETPNFVIHIQLSITLPTNTRELSGKVEHPFWL